MRVALVVLVGLLGMCAPGDREVDDIREATLRHMFAGNGSGLLQGVKVYCVTVEGHDPTADFLSRFAGNRPPLKRGSLCSTSTIQGVLDKETGERGIAFGADKVTMRWGFRAEVEGGYFAHGFSLSYKTYYLEKKGGVWKVVRAVQIGPDV
jgi:hypothetical protein